MFRHLRVKLWRFQQFRQQCVDRLCHARVETLLAVVHGICIKFLALAYHTHSHYSEGYWLLCPFLDNVAVFALTNPQNIEYHFSHCWLHFEHYFWPVIVGVSIPYLGVCCLDHSSGSVFCPQWYCISRSHLQCYSDSEGAGRYPGIHSCAVVWVAWEPTLYNSVKVFSVVDDYHGWNCWVMCRWLATSSVVALLLFRITVQIYSVLLSEVALHPRQIYCTVFVYSIIMSETVPPSMCSCVKKIHYG